VDIFSTSKAEKLAPHRPIDHAMNLEPGFNVPFGLIYKSSEVELRTPKPYIEMNLSNSFIQRSSSSAAAPILLGKKKDGGLQQNVDYQALNSATVKNPYPSPLYKTCSTECT
jgi:hypothetical protein